MKWKIIDTGSASAEENMRQDHELLLNLTTDSPCILRFYSWNAPCATYGYFLNRLTLMNKQELALARRPTGGGIVFHLGDMAFSFLIPSNHPRYSQNTLENYAFINSIILQAIAAYSNQLKPYLYHAVQKEEEDFKNFCMASPVTYDVMLEGRKVAGGAQRRTKRGFLHQGTLSLLQPDEDYLISHLPKRIVDKMKESSYFLVENLSEYHQTILALKEKMIDQVQLKVYTQAS